uniref:Uncharacterized protein n=1 Tax=Meloidogyne incognita TaxID=6306 RepID=A0A914LIE0_MELIC
MNGLDLVYLPIEFTSKGTDWYYGQNWDWLGFDHSCYCHSFLAHCFNLNSFERFKQQEIWTTLDRANFREFAANKAKQA